MRYLVLFTAPEQRVQGSHCWDSSVGLMESQEWEGPLGNLDHPFCMAGSALILDRFLCYF